MRTIATLLCLVIFAWKSSSVVAKDEDSQTVNAEQFGLHSDAEEDQSEHLNRAIDFAAKDSNVDTVYIPTGKYRFTHSIKLRSGVSLIGDGPQRTILEGALRTYLLHGKRLDGDGASVSQLTLNNPHRTVLLDQAKNLRFEHVEFGGGIVRFTNSSDIVLEGNRFLDNRGKSAYASSNCERIKIIHNRFDSIEQGSINLSGHRDCYVAWNDITASKPIDSGYAGIRLPNDAMDNLVEHNVIENHGRGIFVLSSSERNVIRDNVVRTTTKQGVLIQSSRNLLEANVVMNAGEQSVYVVDADAKSSPTPCRADENRILNNIIFDSWPQANSRLVGLKVRGRDTLVQGNRIGKRHDRTPFDVATTSDSVERENFVIDEIEPAFVEEQIHRIRERVAEHQWRESPDSRLKQSTETRF